MLKWILLFIYLASTSALAGFHPNPFVSKLNSGPYFSLLYGTRFEMAGETEFGKPTTAPSYGLNFGHQFITSNALNFSLETIVRKVKFKNLSNQVEEYDKIAGIGIQLVFSVLNLKVGYAYHDFIQGHDKGLYYAPGIEISPGEASFGLTFPFYQIPSQNRVLSGIEGYFSISFGSDRSR